MDFSAYLEKVTLPSGYHADSVKHRMEEWLERIAKLEDEFKRPLLEFTLSEPGKKLLPSIFGNSSYLSRCLISESKFFAGLIQEGFDLSYTHLLSRLTDEGMRHEQQAELMVSLRRAKRRLSLLVAIADISHYWPLESITMKLSIFAEMAVKCATQFLLRRAAAQNEIILPHPEDPEKDSGLVVLAMGKLGAFELNYSSDIDLIIFYGDSKLVYTGRATLARTYIRIAQELSSILQERTREGYVFRTDLRLRPDPLSTPLAVSLKAAENYYESLGQNWERAAMIKARPIAGDPESWLEFSRFITPYVWRRALDFENIQDIHSIKRQIDSKQGDLPEGLLGYHIKLGRGGIREIEFYAQTQQLIWGGRRPSLRVAPTCEALEALVASGEVVRKTADELISAYRFYRTVEHRLQMCDDQQTHSLPDTPERMEAFAVFMGYDNAKTLIDTLTHHLKTVQQHYQRLFESEPTLASTSNKASGSLVFTGTESDPETLKTLHSMGFSNAAYVSETIRGWHYGHARATRVARAREILTKLIPPLLDAFSSTPNPDRAFERFNEFTHQLPVGTQIFSLLYTHPMLLDLLAEIMSSYPYLSANLSRSPVLFDYVLAPEFYEPIPAQGRLRQELAHYMESAQDYQDKLEAVRSWVNDWQFRIGIQLIKRSVTPAESGEHLSDIADVALSVLFEEVCSDFALSHGRLPGSHFAMIALGKLGGRELTLGSDLDLVFIYESTGEESSSDGETPLAASQYVTRLIRRFVTAVTSLTRQGKLYEIDLRLRPSGNDGPIAASLESFIHYYSASAWVWEHMALTRARVIYAETAFKTRIDDSIKTILTRSWEESILRQGVLSMHQKTMEKHRSKNPFHLKHVKGGLVDLEYITQYLLLKYGHSHPAILESNTTNALGNIFTQRIIPGEAASILFEAAILYRDLLCLLRLMEAENPLEEILTEGLKALLIHHGGTDDFDSLKKRLVSTEENVQNLFDSLIRGEATP